MSLSVLIIFLTNVNRFVNLYRKVWYCLYSIFKIFSYFRQLKLFSSYSLLRNQLATLIPTLIGSFNN